jgi:hypothetical protein
MVPLANLNLFKSNVEPLFPCPLGGHEAPA